MFKVGDVVKAKAITPYGVTTNGWIGTVLKIDGNDICVYGKNGRFWVEAKYFELVKPEQIKEENKMDVKEIISEKEREMLLEEMENLLDKYDYNYSEDALDKIIDTWAEDKADLITAFKKHPNYLEGKFMIVFSHNFSRDVDMHAIGNFKEWFFSYEVSTEAREFMPEDMKKWCINNGTKYPMEIFAFFTDLRHMTAQYISSKTADTVNAICSDIRAKEGQKNEQSCEQTV